MAPLSEAPPSTSARTFPTTEARREFSVCSSKMLKERKSDRPELIMVENCREKMANSFSFTRFWPPKLISRLSPLVLTSSSATGV